MSNDTIAAARRFYRTLTLRVGMLTDSFLGRGRPLAQARLLFEIGESGADIRELRAWLGLDAGYLSRLLHAVERDGLVEVVPLEWDLRGRRARLTAAGRRELRALDRLGDRFAEQTFEPLDASERAQLVAAMSQVEKLLNLSFTRIGVEDPDSPDATSCVQKYFAELDAGFETGFDATLSIAAAAADLRAPRGAFLVARLDGRAVGCAAVMQSEAGVGSIKRMWVAPPFRGAGIGRRLLLAIEKEAARLGLGLLRLETHASLRDAQALYRRNGYREVAAFNDEPHAHHWFEKANPWSR